MQMNQILDSPLTMQMNQILDSPLAMQMNQILDSPLAMQLNQILDSLLAMWKHWRLRLPLLQLLRRHHHQRLRLPLLQLRQRQRILLHQPRDRHRRLHRLPRQLSHLHRPCRQEEGAVPHHRCRRRQVGKCRMAMCTSMRVTTRTRTSGKLQ
jgi:hypothetical protein